MMFITKLETRSQAEQLVGLMRESNQLPNLALGDLMQDHFVLIKNGQIVGATAIGRGNWFSAEIFHTCVLPEFHRQGIATTLNEFAIYYAQEVLQKKVLTCTVRDDNVASKGLVKKIGFQQACSFENNGNKINFYVRGLE